MMQKDESSIPSEGTKAVDVEVDWDKSPEG
jgi:hypothetical protein